MTQATAKHDTTRQRELVLAHLQEGKSLDAAQALRLYGIRRLAARVHELKTDGVGIHATMVPVATRQSRPTKIARYRLVTPATA